MSILQRPAWVPPVMGEVARPGFAWDEWNVTKAYRPGDSELQARMAVLTHRANMAMCTAIAEWVVWRFESQSVNFRPLLMLEAAWAAGVHTAYARYPEFHDDDWRGVVRGPIRIAIGIVADLVWGLKTAVPGRNVAWASQLAEHVRPDAAVFRTWRDACVARLEVRFRASTSDVDVVFEDEVDIGSWVPRELFDPMREVRQDEARSLVAGFVASLDPHRNPWLHMTEEMRGFSDYKGTPYRITSRDR